MTPEETAKFAAMEERLRELEEQMADIKTELVEIRAALPPDEGIGMGAWR